MVKSLTPRGLTRNLRCAKRTRMLYWIGVGILVAIGIALARVIFEALLALLAAIMDFLERF